MQVLISLLIFCNAGVLLSLQLTPCHLSGSEGGGVNSCQPCLCSSLSPGQAVLGQTACVG